MQTVPIIIGMPGSGKTTFIENNRLEFRQAIILDDYHKSAKGHSKKLYSGKYFGVLKKSLLNGRDAVISDIIYCKSNQLAQIKSELRNLFHEIGVSATIECIYFENDPGACMNNVYTRNRKNRITKEIDFIKNVTNKYIIPSNARKLAIYKK